MQNQSVHKTFFAENLPSSSPEIKDTLSRIVQNPRTHAQWLNSISYLEYRGFRKIVRSQKTLDMTYDRLMHTYEEVRHAIFFKRQAMKLGGKEFETFHDPLLLAATATKLYFWQLDEGVSQQIQLLQSDRARNAAYCLITWLIEQRAMSVYQAYQEVLQESESQPEFSLEPILKEEDNHLKEMADISAQIIETEGKAIGLDAISLEEKEARAFAEFWNSIQDELKALELKN